MRKKFNHAFALAFEVESDREDAADVTPFMFEQAVQRRMQQLTADNEWTEAVGDPFDTYEVEQ